MVKAVASTAVGWKNKDKVFKLTVVGKVMGYPPCCVRRFANRITDGDLSPPSLARSAMALAPKTCRYHWIPCDACARKIIARKATFASLLTYKRPLTELMGKLGLPAVRAHARALLVEEEF